MEKNRLDKSGFYVTISENQEGVIGTPLVYSIIDRLVRWHPVLLEMVRLKIS